VPDRVGQREAVTRSEVLGPARRRKPGPPALLALALATQVLTSAQIWAILNVRSTSEFVWDLRRTSLGTKRASENTRDQTSEA
jgi:hypothetical protein